MATRDIAEGETIAYIPKELIVEFGAPAYTKRPVRDPVYADIYISKFHCCLLLQPNGPLGSHYCMQIAGKQGTCGHIGEDSGLLRRGFLQ